MPIIAKHFFMIRHGETEANAARIMAGSLDSPLTEKGRNQARKARDIVKMLHTKPSTIVHSNLSRARDTAQIINEALNVPMHEDPDLAEFHAGDWEGVPYEHCEELLTGWPDPPNGETYHDFTQRIRNGKNRALENYDGPVLIVAHGGVFRGLGKLYNLNTPGVFKNCHLYEFEPNLENIHFPWRVYSYGHDQESLKMPTDIFDKSEKF